MRSFLFLIVIGVFCCRSFAADTSTSIELAGGFRHFHTDSTQGQTEDYYRNAIFIDSVANVEHSFGEFSFKGRLYASWDEKDRERRYTDVREAQFTYAPGSVHLSAGIGNFFWGVSETVNIINVSNQSDFRKDVDGKDKMGQQFLNAGVVLGNSSINLFHFPNFVELSYPVRPASSIPILSDDSQFEKREKSSNALRWMISTDSGEMAFTYFKGVRRDPYLIPTIDSSLRRVVSLSPFYVSTEFVALDALYFVADATLKLDLKYGLELDDHYTAYNIGFEYPFYSPLTGIQELVWITEYINDSRGTTAESFAQDDLFIGWRAVLGSLGDIDLRGTFAIDTEYSSKYINVDIDKRLNNYLSAHVKLVHFVDVGEQDFRLGLLESEDFAQVSLSLSF